MRLNERLDAKKHNAGSLSDAYGAHPSSSCGRDQRGFTLTELITIIVIVGILSVAAIPRFFDRGAFDSRRYHDEVVAVLRYAQKSAISQHRLVCVTFSVNSVTLTIDSAVPAAGACGGGLTGPTGVTPYTVNAPSGVTLSNFANFNFDFMGRPMPTQPGGGINVSGNATTPIVVEAQTGYVH